jgi:hypothetical protein
LSFDSVLGVLSLSIGFAAVILGLMDRPVRPKWVVAVLAACGIALILFTVYFALIYVNHETEVRRIQVAILQAVDGGQLTFEQIRDNVVLEDTAATSREILEAMDQLQSDGLLHATRADWQDVNAKRFYTKIFTR